MKYVVIDPRVKLLVFLVSCVLVMSTTQLIPLLLIGSFILLLLLLSGEVKSALPMMILFVLSLFIPHFLGVNIGGLAAVLLRLLCFFIRIIIPVAMSFQLVFRTTTMSQFMSAFEKMHVPAVAAIPFAVMFRFIPTVQEEWRGIRQAMAFRGIKVGFAGIVRHPVKSVEYIVVPLIFSATSIMDELAAASLARGLDSEHKRICALEVRLKWFDWVFLMLALAFLIYWIIVAVGGGTV